MTESNSPTKLIRTLSTQHWEVTEDNLLKNSLLEDKAGEYGNYKFIVRRESLQSIFLLRETYENKKLLCSVKIPVKTLKEYIDFYGYDREKYDMLTKDFLDCIKEYEPIVDPSVFRINTPCHRYERVIWVKGIVLAPIFASFVENAMKDKGYQRYKDYNFYEHASL